MASDQIVPVSQVWQLGHVGKGPDAFALPPYCLVECVQMSTHRKDKVHACKYCKSMGIVSS